MYAHAAALARSLRQAAAMLLRFHALRQCSIRARDGELGSLDDLLFDERTWSIRHLVVDTGKGFAHRWVLLDREVVRAVDLDARRVDVALDVQEVREAPGIETDPPRSQQRRIAFLDDYRAWLPWKRRPGASPMATQGATDGGFEHADEETRHTRSAAEIVGYAVLTSDRQAGAVEDVVVDDEEWRLPCLAVTTGGSRATSNVLVGSDAVQGIDLTEGLVKLSLTADELAACRTYDAAAQVVAERPGGENETL